MNITLKWISIVASIIGAIFLSMIVFFVIGNRAPPVVIAVKLVEPILSVVLPELVGVGDPSRIKIPRIGVDAVVLPTGVTLQGAMGVPKGPSDTAWFDLGPRPGETGSSVIAGHFGWKNGVSAVFDDLHTLRKGDEIYVIDERGATSTFVVRKAVLYGENDDATAVFYSTDGLAHLNLITCEGVWNKTLKSYADRLVVFADKES